MRKLFGTDGIRGKANVYPMTGELAFRLGQAAARVLQRKGEMKVIIGKDTRRSGYIFEYALTAGLCSMGADVHLVGPMPTPAIAHLVRSFAADAGIVISASHNPAQDNGIKFFDSQGYKLPDKTEEKIEELVLGRELSAEGVARVGKAYRIDDAQGRYIEFAKGTIENQSLSGLKVVLDCANGAAYRVAPLILGELGAEVKSFAVKPDGANINKDCGSLNTDILKSAVLGHSADVGMALDGDADRVIMVDEKGLIFDGDHIMAALALDQQSRGLLAKDTVVATVMSNMALERFLSDNGISLVRTQVGDRYIIEEMRRKGYSLGGEQSGHIILAEKNTTGDGTVAALKVLAVMVRCKKKLSELRSFEPYPQLLVNIPVKAKKPIEKLPSVGKEIRAAEKLLAGRGRVLVRYSGTENKCRVMVEAESGDLAGSAADMIAEKIREEIGA